MKTAHEMLLLKDCFLFILFFLFCYVFYAVKGVDYGLKLGCLGKAIFLLRNSINI